jgi:mRNA-degrading endonuclease toxin of MazEF toxin-antitoxin module
MESATSVYLVPLDPTSGHEQQGTRPVLIVSPGAFNRLTKTPVVLPIITDGHFARTAGCTVSLMGARTNTTGVIALRTATRDRYSVPPRPQAGKRTRDRHG